MAPEQLTLDSALTTPTRTLTHAQKTVIAEKQRRSANTDRILAALERAGAAGLTNVELQTIGGFRYAARLFEIKKQGHAWGKEHLGGGLWRYFIVKGEAA